jgi:AAA domain
VQPTEGTGQEETSCKQWLVDRYLGAGEASAMYGKPGDGKSVLAEDMGLHVAAGAAGTWEHSNAYEPNPVSFNEGSKEFRPGRLARPGPAHSPSKPSNSLTKQTGAVQVSKPESFEKHGTTVPSRS